MASIFCMLRDIRRISTTIKSVGQLVIYLEWYLWFSTGIFFFAALTAMRLRCNKLWGGRYLCGVHPSPQFSRPVPCLVVVAVHSPVVAPYYRTHRIQKYDHQLVQKKISITTFSRSKATDSEHDQQFQHVQARPDSNRTMFFLAKLEWIVLVTWKCNRCFF